MKITAKTPDEYLAQVDEKFQSSIIKLRETVLENLPEGFEECMNYKMIGYVVPHTLYPSGYHCNTALPLPFINLAAQKNFIGFYHMGIYANPDLMKWFVSEYEKTVPSKLDMGKSCVRLKKTEHIPYELFAELVKKMSAQDWIDLYEENIKK